MGTEILIPQDCLIRSTTSMVIPRGKPSTNSYYYTNPNPKFYRKTEQRKQQQQQQQAATTTPSVVKNGVRSSPSTPTTTISVVKRDLTTSATVVKNGSPTTTKSVVKRDLTTSVVKNVTILKRGESLYNINSRKKTENLRIKRSVSGDLSSGFSSSGSESSDGERVVVRSEVYAGNAFYLSPAPSSLPLPNFSIKKEGGGLAIVDDSATKDLRRLLRLD